MIATLTIPESKPNRISLYILLAFLLLLPFDLFYSQLAMIVFAIHTIIHLDKTRLPLLLSKPVLLLGFLYILVLLGILYSPDRKEGFNLAGRQTALAFMPILLALNPLDLSKYKFLLLRAFGLGCTVVILYLYGDALYTIYYYKLPLTDLFSQAFINHNFSLPIGIHATYFSMYLGISFIAFLYEALHNSSRWWYWLCMLILVAGLVQLSSRAVVFALLIVINVVFPFFLQAGKQRFRYIVVTVILSLLCIFSVLSISSFKTRYVSDLKNDLERASVYNEMTEPRAERWKIGIELIKQAPLIGHGTGAEKELLKDEYFNRKLYVSYLQELNVHNQYLSLMIRYGIVGLAIYCYFLYFGFALAIKKREPVFIGLLLIVSTVSVSENILDVNKALFFFSFFMSFFLFSFLPAKPKNRQPVDELSRFYKGPEQHQNQPI